MVAARRRRFFFIAVPAFRKRAWGNEEIEGRTRAAVHFLAQPIGCGSVSSTEKLGKDLHLRGFLRKDEERTNGRQRSPKTLESAPRESCRACVREGNLLVQVDTRH
jgi:hypothetical protein